MRLFSIAAIAITLAGSAVAQDVNWAAATRVEVALASFSFTPAPLRLRAGVPTALVLNNVSSGGHNFSAPDFFAAATIRAADRAALRRGAVEVRRGSAVTIALVPRAGRYRLRCTHLLHTGLGMSGEIIVE